MKIEFFWDVTLRLLTNSDVYKNGNILFQW